MYAERCFILNNMYKVVDLIYQGINALEETLGFPVELCNDKGKYDAVINIKGDKFICLTKKYAKNESNNALKELAINIDNNANKILIADHLPKNKAAFLKKNQINYLDAAGNAYIETDSLFIYIEGKAAKITFANNQTRAFQEAGLKLLLLLISQPDSLDLTYREMAKKTGVSTGSISNILKELEAENYLLRSSKKKILKNKEELINRWVINYKDYLKPRVKRQQMRALGDFNSKELLKSKLDFYFGGEPGGELLTQRLKPKDYIIYSNEDIKTIAQTLKLVPDESGNIELYQQFWTAGIAEKEIKVAPRLVVYADLLNTGNNRNIETAKLILKDGL